MLITQLDVVPNTEESEGNKLLGGFGFGTSVVESSNLFSVGAERIRDTAICWLLVVRSYIL